MNTSAKSPDLVLHNGRFTMAAQRSLILTTARRLPRCPTGRTTRRRQTCGRSGARSAAPAGRSDMSTHAQGGLHMHGTRRCFGALHG